MYNLFAIWKYIFFYIFKLQFLKSKLPNIYFLRFDLKS